LKLISSTALARRVFRNGGAQIARSQSCIESGTTAHPLQLDCHWATVCMVQQLV
jgi:hypothetical protein